MRQPYLDPGQADTRQVGSDDQSAAHITKLRALLRRDAPSPPTLRAIGPPRSGMELAVFADCPRPGLTTLVTVGFSVLPFSIWRTLPLGMELALTTSDDQGPFVELLGSLVSAAVDPRAADRRRIVEHNGVWAPGYAPHLVFTDRVSATPQLMVQRKVGGRYVQWLSAIPIDDAELRRYDRDIPAFLDELTPDSITTYPRLPPAALQ